MEPTATWSPDRQVWETGQADLFSERLEPFSGTWPTSGMTLSGRLYPLPPSAHPTSASGSSSSPGPLLITPTSRDSVPVGPAELVQVERWAAGEVVPQTYQRLRVQALALERKTS